VLEFYICTGDAMIKRSASGDDSKSKRWGRNMGGRLAGSQEPEGHQPIRQVRKAAKVPVHVRAWGRSSAACVFSAI
jgi:hypothetical protein